jgi:hypothetical protein
MALTINQQPQAYTPVFNPQIFHATSTNSGAANHTYTFVFTDVLSGLTGTVQVTKDPVFSAGVFDAMEKTKDFIKYFEPIYTGGWQRALGSLRPITVNVGETYGSTPTYYPGTTITYYVWSGGVDWMDFANNGFVNTPYIYNFSTNKVFMAGVLDDLTFTGKSNYIYILSNHLTGARPKQIRITTYNAAGGLVGTSYIANPHEAGSNTYDKNFVFIDVGDRGLNALTAPQVTGTFPVIGASVVRWDVHEDNLLGAFTFIKSIKYGCENIYKPMVLHYLAKNGAFQTASFNLMHDKKIKKQNLTYGKDTNFYTGVQYAYDISSRPMRQYGTTTQTSLILRTDWLSDDQVEKYEDLFSSSVIFLDGDENYPNKLIAINCETQDYITIPKRKSKLFAFEAEFTYAHQNIRQDVRG